MRTELALVIAVAAAATATTTTVAAAEPTRKVEVETEPAGATVYLSSKENGPVCDKTPCSFDAPLGDTPIIVELEGHSSVIETLSIPTKRDKKPIKVSYTLQAAVGTIKVEGPAGAKITINEEDRGTAPTEIEIEAGSYIVVLRQPGKPPESLPVDVEAGGEVSVTGGAATPPPDEPTGGTRKRASSIRGAYIRASLALDVGIRDFTYDNNQTTMTLSNEREPGALTAGPVVEFWPGNLAGVRALRGLSLLARIQFGLNKLTLEAPQLMSTATTFWQSIEASVRHRWTIKRSATLEVGTGYVRDRFQFNGEIEDIRLLPDADYQSLRIGLRGSLLLGTDGAWEPFVSAENRIVVSAGAMESRFNTASTSGLRGSAGVVATFGKLAARLEASLTRYSWTFTYASDGEFKADGGVDSIKQVAVSVGYTY